MGTINFGGLATGLDTESIISSLMQIERQPLDKLETEKAYYQNRLTAFSEFDTKLKAFMSAMEDLDTGDEVRSYSATSASEDYFKATGTSSALPGSYQIEVVDLAQLEKQISQGYADKTTSTFGTGTLNLTVDGTLHNITIDSNNNSLEGIAGAINDADAGVTASIINDGTGTPYRLVITGDAVQDTADGATQAITLDASGLSGGTDANPTTSVVQYAQKAHIKVDTIDIYSTNNTLDEAIPGVTLDLTKSNATGETTNLTVGIDKEGTKEKVNAFVTAYNEVLTFISAQSDADWANDASFRSVKRKIQDLLVTTVSTGGTYTSLSSMGVETDQKAGTISISTTDLDAAIAADYDSVVALFGGGTGFDGIAKQFSDYLETATDSVDGIYASKKDATDSTLKSLDLSIERWELRLETRESNLRRQYEALELLVSELNSQGSYLTNALSNINLGGKQSS